MLMKAINELELMNWNELTKFWSVHSNFVV